MNILYPEHRIILKTLLAHHVDFILIGGYAVNYYGYNRVTGDMDIWIKPDNSNKELLVAALASLGFDEEGIITIRNWDFTQPQKFHIGHENQPDKTEFMTHISGITYEDAKKNHIIARIDEMELPMIHYNNLIQNKKNTGRIKDLADAEYLEKIMKLKKRD
jgi:sulfur carrier protein ThiS